MSGTGIEVSPDMDPEAALIHYGVKGMQWGKRTIDGGSGSDGSGSTLKTKPTSSEIRNARLSINQQKMEFDHARRWAKANTAKGSTERMLADKKISELKVDFLNNPDRVTSMRLTKGEKIVFAAISPVSFVGVGAGLGVNALSRRSIEKKQRRGAYDK